MTDMLAAAINTLDTTDATMAGATSPTDSTGDNSLVSISTRFHLGERDMQDADLVLFATDN
ncbi:hypothetical protein FRC09_009303, partial [Ceratobasidium sp. 395]